MQFADNVKSVRKLDNNIVEFRLTQPDASFLWHLATHYASVMSAEYAAQLTKQDHPELIDRQPVGTGPFSSRNIAPDNIFVCSVMRDSGVVNR